MRPTAAMEFQWQASSNSEQFYYETEHEEEGPSNNEPAQPPPPAPPCAAEPQVLRIQDLVTAIATVGKQHALVKDMLRQHILAHQGIGGQMRGLLIGARHKNVSGSI